MSQIQIEQLSFCWPGAAQPVFEKLSLVLDTDWRLGLTGPNGSGKTTLLRLLAGELAGTGQIRAAVQFSLFPPPQPPGWQQMEALALARETVAPFAGLQRRMEALLAAGGPAALEEYGVLEGQYAALGGYEVDARLAREAERLKLPPRVFTQPFGWLSGGEQAKLLLAALFVRRNHFLLIDEPTNHLDLQGRAQLGRYLAGKRGFLLVSHDRALLDAATDHTLVLGPGRVQLQQGSYTSWRDQQDRQEAFEEAQDEKLQREIRRLKEAAARAANWAQAAEKEKKGKNTAGLHPDRGYLGARAARVMKGAKNLQNRRERAIEEKQALLSGRKKEAALQLGSLEGGEKPLLQAQQLVATRGGRALFAPVSFSLRKGQRLAVAGPNGSGKTTLLQLLAGEGETQGIGLQGSLWRQGPMAVSTLPQDTGQLRGPLWDWPAAQGLRPELFFALLRKLGFSREELKKEMSGCSQGQRKKILLAGCLARPAHLYLWDEPLNFLDLPTREQIEQLLQESGATLVFVEHDARFLAAVATDTLTLQPV